MSIIQGKRINSLVEKLATTQSIQALYTSENTSEKAREKLDELINFVQLKHHLLARGYVSFHIKIADNTYYQWSLGLLTREA